MKIPWDLSADSGDLSVGLYPLFGQAPSTMYFMRSLEPNGFLLERGNSMSQAGGWILDAVSSIDPAVDLVILENPRICRELDKKLNSIWPRAKAHLESTGHIYTPGDEPRIESKPTTVLTRTLMWMIHDMDCAVHRGILELNQKEWMLHSEFFLSLPAGVDLRFVTEILGNSRFTGNPPQLMIYKRSPVHHYQITLNSGNGESYLDFDADYVFGRIKECIDANVSMYELTIDGEWSEEIVGEFLTESYRVYESF